MSESVDPTTRSRWLDWKTGAPILAEPARNEPAKPPKPGFAGFDGADHGQSSEMEDGQGPAPADPCQSDSERPVVEFVTLRGGLTVPLPAVHLALDLERRSSRQTVGAEGTYAIDAAAALTDTDRTGIARWRQHLAAIVAYECPRNELPQ